MINKSARVTIVDYGVGNLLSVVRALEKCGANALLTNDAKSIIEANRLILPGVGAFSKGMEGLIKRELIEPIKIFSTKERPFLGICLGMQMMFERSNEFGSHLGLGFIPGEVVAIPSTTITGELHKIPHIGWNGLLYPTITTDWNNTILKSVRQFDSVYFVHSFAANPTHEENLLANCKYNGRVLSSVVQSDNMYGCQFHPEKSGPIGLKILENFCFHV